MKNELNKILTELSYRVKDGVPNLNNEQHLIKLFDVLKEFNWPIEARVELIQNLTESEAGDQAKKLGLMESLFLLRDLLTLKMIESIKLLEKIQKNFLLQVAWTVN